MQPLVYLTNPFLKSLPSMLSTDWHVIEGWENTENRDLVEVLALGTTVWDLIDEEFMSQFPKLKYICHLGLGTDNIDKLYLEKKGITLMSQPHAGVHDTAELGLALMLSLARKIVLNDRFTRNNAWAEKRPKMLGNHLFAKRLGLVGLGQIGSMMAKFAEPLGMRIAYTALSNKNNAYEYYPSIDRLALDSDFLMVCCSGGPETKHLINKQVLECLGPNGFLINVARGSVVDQQALIHALKNHEIAGAGLDVYQNEPEVPETLRSLDNVVLSPHMGSSTHENLQAMFRLQADQLNQILVGS
ncbi:NAD(P)-dependent oxidoreductase [Legionella waltersii]|uniref:D-isomer specific 2-hydroxyacid dehydrogenase n=1 Tax=Legionella waltersii TaxID=66969 RepID=A0A0W1AD62_9GAMM|nr:NAD(P)-dependent oxidoreductase [Legionella waltersii]KTD79282.1 D-isomer specific 2-hydroxyacid dehydrogenase [Legionella waltersii]SNV12873.1 D-isomer specific 2-hydroxyacid dehydrogenase [Legionella waltersii]